MSENFQQNKTNLKIKSGDENRIDKYLAALYPDYSRTYFKRLINQRLIQVDDHPVSPNHPLRQGQQVTITWPRPEKIEPKEDVEIPFPILHEDEDLIIINKPPHLLCHPTGWKRSGDTLVELLSSKVSRGNWPDEIRPGLIHRL